MNLNKKSIYLNGFCMGVIHFSAEVHFMFACPVCGCLAQSDRLPVDEAMHGLIFSWDICSCCNTQYGLDDDFELGENGLENAWTKLRQKWLSGIQVTPEICSQLQNIDVDVYT